LHIDSVGDEIIYIYIYEQGPKSNKAQLTFLQTEKNSLLSF